MTTTAKKTDHDTVEIFSIYHPDMARIEAEARLMQAEAVVDSFIALGRFLKRLGRAVARPVTLWRERQRGFIELSEMDSQQLADIGLTEGDVPAPANRDFQKRHVA